MEVSTRDSDRKAALGLALTSLGVMLFWLAGGLIAMAKLENIAALLTVVSPIIFVLGLCAALLADRTKRRHLLTFSLACILTNLAIRISEQPEIESVAGITGLLAGVVLLAYAGTLSSNTGASLLSFCFWSLGALVTMVMIILFVLPSNVLLSLLVFLSVGFVPLSYIVLVGCLCFTLRKP